MVVVPVEWRVVDALSESETKSGPAIDDDALDTKPSSKYQACAEVDAV